MRKSRKKMELMTIHRLSPPNQYDQAEQGAKCIVTEGNEKILYVQKSQDDTNPCWTLIGPYEEEIIL